MRPQVNEAEQIGRVVSERSRVGQATATAERIGKVGLDGLETTPPSKDHPAGQQRILAAPLDRLWKQGRITRREFEAGERHRGDAYLAAIDPGTMSVDWNRAGGGGSSRFVPSMFTVQHIADARNRYRAYERAMPLRSVVRTVIDLTLIREMSLEEIGRMVFGCPNHRDARSAAYGAFRTALGALADHYGV